MFLSLYKVITGDCPNIALVPIGTTTWYRANTVTATSTALTFDSYGLGTTEVHSTSASDHDVVLNATIAATAHLAYKLGAGLKVGLSTGGKGDTTLAEITARLAELRTAELATYTKYGKMARTKSAVQSAVMWQTVWNPLEQGPFAYVDRLASLLPLLLLLLH